MAMGLHDDGTLNISTGYFYLAPTGTAFPGDPANPEADGWVKVGHTKIDEIATISSEGGDKTTLGTLQSKTLRQSVAPKTTTYGFTLEQFDLASLQLYYGTTAAVEPSGIAAGLLGVPDDATPTEKALLIIVWDGARPFGWYAPKASIIGGADISLSDSTALSGMEILCTPLNYLGATKKVYTLPLSVDALVVPNASTVSPTSGPAGTPVVITAAASTFFSGITTVKFGTTDAALFRVTSATTISAVVPVGGSTGSQAITVSNAAGPDTTTVAFTKS